MSNKTDYIEWNDEDFVQNNDTLTELTVTITLCEYRKLLIDSVLSSNKIEELEKELNNTEEAYKMILQTIFDESPELKNSFSAVYKHFFQKEEGETDEGT